MFQYLKLHLDKMTIDSLKRVIFRLQEMKPEHDIKTYSLRQLRLAIMEEIGTDDRTLIRSISRLQELEYMRKVSNDKWSIRVEGNALS